MAICQSLASSDRDDPDGTFDAAINGFSLIFKVNFSNAGRHHGESEIESFFSCSPDSTQKPFGNLKNAQDFEAGTKGIEVAAGSPHPTVD